MTSGLGIETSWWSASTLPSGCWLSPQRSWHHRAHGQLTWVVWVVWGWCQRERYPVWLQALQSQCSASPVATEIHGMIPPSISRWVQWKCVISTFCNDFLAMLPVLPGRQADLCFASPLPMGLRHWGPVGHRVVSGRSSVTSSKRSWRQWTRLLIHADSDTHFCISHRSSHSIATIATIATSNRRVNSVISVLISVLSSGPYPWQHLWKRCGWGARDLGGDAGVQVESPDGCGDDAAGHGVGAGGGQGGQGHFRLFFFPGIFMDVIFCQILSDSDIMSHMLAVIPKNCCERWQNASGALCLGHLATFGFVKR